MFKINVELLSSKCISSEEVQQLVEVEVVWDVADLASIDGDLVCEHAGSGDLDGVGPVEVVVAEGVREVQDGFLADA